MLTRTFFIMPEPNINSNLRAILNLEGDGTIVGTITILNIEKYLLPLTIGVRIGDKHSVFECNQYQTPFTFNMVGDINSSIVVALGTQTEKGIQTLGVVNTNNSKFDNSIYTQNIDAQPDTSHLYTDYTDIETEDNQTYTLPSQDTRHNIQSSTTLSTDNQSGITHNNSILHSLEHKTIQQQQEIGPTSTQNDNCTVHPNLDNKFSTNNSHTQPQNNEKINFSLFEHFINDTEKYPNTSHLFEDYSQNDIFAQAENSNNSNQDPLNIDNVLLGDNNFYNLISPQLNHLFVNYPRFTQLENIVENSEWIKVSYTDNGEGHYILGKLYDNGIVSYICYGIPSTNRLTPPPAELIDYCQWLPLQPNDVDGEGYWVMYQSAETGENYRL